MAYSVPDMIRRDYPLEAIEPELRVIDVEELGDIFSCAVFAGREDVAAVAAERMPSFASFREHTSIKQAAQKDMAEVFRRAFDGPSKGFGIAGYALKMAVNDGRRETAEVIAHNLETRFWNEQACDAAAKAAHMGWTNFFRSVYDGKSGGAALGVGYALEAGKHQQWHTARYIEMCTGIKAAELKHS